MAKVPLVAVVKEVAPTAKAETDEELGVGTFQEEYFGGRPTYLDSEKRFYEFLGNRKITGLLGVGDLLRPWRLYAGYKQMQARLKDKAVEGNMAGEGIVLGGLLVLGPAPEGNGGDAATVLYSYKEETGSEVPLEDFEQGFLKLSTDAAAAKEL